MLKDPGYWIFDHVFEPAEMIALAELICGGKRAGKRNLMSHYAVREVANSDKLLDITEKLAGRRLTPYKAPLFEKTGKANWLVAYHQDTALPIKRGQKAQGWGSHSVKGGINFAHAPEAVLSQIIALRVHIDPSTEHNGPLRVIPNSHRKLLLSEADLGLVLDKINEVTCTTSSGGVIAMSPLLLHASSKCSDAKPRRVLHIEYAPKMSFEDGMELTEA